MSKLIFITGPSCAGKSTRFSHLWDTLSATYNYEDKFEDVYRVKADRTTNEHVARVFPELGITLHWQKD